jgi:hypothetical protein
VKHAARPSLRPLLRLRPVRSDNPVGLSDKIKAKAPGDSSAAGKGRQRGRVPPQVSDYSVSFELPEASVISENELRALETLLGLELKQLLTK